MELGHSASYEIVYTTLKKRILSLELIPGSLVSEIETAKEFSVSRTPVRDAFKALVSEHLLEVKPHIGTFVTLINMNEIADSLYIRETIEKAVINELVYSFSQSQEYKLHHILHTQKELLHNHNLTSEVFAVDFAKSDDDFHQSLFHLAGKTSLIQYLQNINAPYERFRSFLVQEDRATFQVFYNQHIQLLDHIKNKEIDKLNHMISHHIYDGFNNSTDLIYKYPSYFAKL